MDDNIVEELSGPSFTIDNGTPAIVFEDGTIKHTTAPQLFDTGSGAYLGYADNWETELNKLFPDGYETEAQQAYEQYGVGAGNPPSLWLLVAITLEP
jgi:hypothetical protein